MIRLGRRWLAIFAAVFVVLPIVDIWLLVLVSHRVGAAPILALVLLEAALGVWLIRRRWRSVWRTLQDSRAGSIAFQRPGESIAQAIDTVLVVAGATALIFPGLITDLIGIICLVPLTRRLPAAMLRRMVERRVPGLGDMAGLGDVAGPARGRRPSGYGDVIEGEVVETPADGDPEDPDQHVVIRGEVTDS